MDRRNGGDILAPPRPPKHLPRIHRPRAPEPETMLSEIQMQLEWQQQQQQRREQEQQQMTTSTTAAAAVAAATAAATTPSAITATTTTTTSTALTQCTNGNNQQQQQQQQQHQQNLNSNNHPSQYSITSIDQGVGTGTSTITSTSQNGNVNVANVVNTLTQPEYDDYEIHHLTILPQRPTTLNLSRNNSHVSTTSSSTSSSSITAASTFTRRRQLPPTPGAAARLLVNSNSTNSNNARTQANTNTNSGLSAGIAGLLSHFHSTEPAAAATSVTLAQPRPESQRLTNEYVDTPFRNAAANAVIPNQLQLQHASRAQHPAGQHDGGQTTTHHLLLLPQREFRLQHQQNQQHQQHQQHQHQQLLHATNRTTTGTVGSATIAAGIDGTDGFIHSHHNHKTPTSSTAAATTTCPHTGKVIPVASQNGHHHSGVGSGGVGLGSFTSSQQSFTPAITKQPASTTNNTNTTTSQMSHVDSNNCKFAKDLPAFDDLLTMHNIATGISTPQGMISAVHGASPLGTPIIIGGGDTSSLNQIICPRCGHCRCEQCQSPPHLPQTWLCNKTCLCSAESVIDYVSCLCCAKALFYHCARDNDMDCDDGSGTPCVDNPCSCGPYKRTQRWGWLGALSLVLPCLWLYWPMRGCVSFCEKCYGRIVGRGCRCQQTDSPTNIIPISQLGLTGNSSSGTTSILSGNNGGSDSLKSVDVHHHHHTHHHHHHNHMRKGDVTPKKRLLDSNGEY